MTGRDLFEKEHKDEINAHATRRREASLDGGSHAGFYQTVLKEMWKDEPEKEQYAARVRKLVADIPQYVMPQCFHH
jgi:hypothetical protein